jgi:hypothetical protein
MQPPGSDSYLFIGTPIVCTKCHTTVPDSVALFCEQCGYRLRRSRRQKKSKSQRKQSQPAGGLSTASLSAETVGDGWFWGADEVPQLGAQANWAVPGDALLPKESHPKHPFAKAHTASGGCRDPNAVGRPLRRICSLGPQPSFLPALAQSFPRERSGEDPSERRESPTKPTTSTPPFDDARQVSNPCGILWGHVLAEAIAEFESKQIILAVEIDSDERCICVLSQKLQIEDAARSKYVVTTGISPLRHKLNELEKKVRINKEKLVMVQQRLAALNGQHARDEGGSPVDKRDCGDAPPDPGDSTLLTKQGNQCEPVRDDRKCGEPTVKRKKKKKHRKNLVTASTSSVRDAETEAAAILIQKRFRVLRARRLFASMVQRAYQRVFDPASKRYFYYNTHTSQSQWETPSSLVKANTTTVAQRRRRRVASTMSLDVAASRIQALYRRRSARRAVRELLLQVYEKVYDPDSNAFFYYCSRTKTSSWEKPKLLREGDDIPKVRITAKPSARDAAATTIQTLFRTRATRRFLRDLATGLIEKHFDAEAHAWYYFNSRTQQSFWETPRHASLLTTV